MQGGLCAEASWRRYAKLPPFTSVFYTLFFDIIRYFVFFEVKKEEGMTSIVKLGSSYFYTVYDTSFQLLIFSKQNDRKGYVHLNLSLLLQLSGLLLYLTPVKTW